MATHRRRTEQGARNEGRVRAWWNGLEPRRQTGMLAVLAILAICLMLILNPFSSGASDARNGTQATKPSDSAAGTQGKPMSSPAFDGTPTEIGQQVQQLLDDPTDGNVDDMATLLYRYGDKDLARATIVYDAIGAGETAPRVRTQAKAWWAKASAAAAAQRYKDLSATSASLTKAAGNLARLHGTTPSSCDGLSDTAKAAASLVDKGPDASDYRTLTDMQQKAISAITGCSTSMDADTVTKVFGPSQTNDDGGTR